MKRLQITGLLLVFALFMPMSFAQSELEKPVIDLLVTPTLILGQGRYAQAADSFHAQSKLVLTLEQKLGTKAMWQAAGLADGLAAMAAEKSRDPIAYEYWANSVRYFLMSGSRWDELQTQLHQEFEYSSSRLQVSIAPADTGVSVDSTWLELFSLVEVWQEKLSYFSYHSPSSELANIASQQQRSDRQVTTSNGSQLRQYSPNNPLKINGEFQSRSTFRPEGSNSNPKSVTVKKSVSPSTPDVSKVEPVVVTTAIPTGRNIIEQDARVTNSNVSVEVPNATEDAAGKFRGNLGAESSKGITASQRRSFAPEINE